MFFSPTEMLNPSVHQNAVRLVGSSPLQNAIGTSKARDWFGFMHLEVFYPFGPPKRHSGLITFFKTPPGPVIVLD